MIVERVELGTRCIPYEEAWARQRRIHERVSRGETPGRMLLLEHSAVYTAGKLSARDELPADPGGTPVVTTDRGGKVTWHGPGQLVGYPIVPLPANRDVVAFVRALESLLIDVAQALGVHARTVRGRTGVWSMGGDAKVAAIGLRVSRATSMHGFALNCCNDLAPFERFVPCGIRDAGVTSLSLLAGRRITPLDAAAIVERLVAERGLPSPAVATRVHDGESLMEREVTRA